ncbi:MAG: hypothetical protein AAGA23_11475, partial [Pseudomonadota bacterium]
GVGNHFWRRSWHQVSTIVVAQAKLSSHVNLSERTPLDRPTHSPGKQRLMSRRWVVITLVQHFFFSTAILVAITLTLFIVLLLVDRVGSRIAGESSRVLKPMLRHRESKAQKGERP